MLISIHEGMENLRVTLDKSIHSAVLNEKFCMFIFFIISFFMNYPIYAIDSGEQVDPDSMEAPLDEAYTLVIIKRACRENGNMASCLELASIEEKEKGNKKYADKLRKKVYSKYKNNKKACDKGNMKRCADIAQFEKDMGNKKLARQYYIKACNGGNMDYGCFALGGLEHAEGNEKKAYKFYEKACNGGYLTGCDLYGVMLMVNKKKGTNSKGKKILRKTCNKGYKPACERLKNVKKGFYKN